MGKSELFEGRGGRMLVRLGAFPVRRGASDAEALETGATIVPARSRERSAFAGPVPSPGRVRVSFGEPITVTAAEPMPEAASELLDDKVWSEVESERQRLLTHPGVIAGALAALGVGAGGGVLEAELDHGLGRRELERLVYAMQHHSGGSAAPTHADATIGACWDSDRLTLDRVHIEPEELYLSTPAVREDLERFRAAAIEFSEGEELGWEEIAAAF